MSSSESQPEVARFEALVAEAPSLDEHADIGKRWGFKTANLVLAAAQLPHGSCAFPAGVAVSALIIRDWPGPSELARLGEEIVVLMPSDSPVDKAIVRTSANVEGRRDMSFSGIGVSVGGVAMDSTSLASAMRTCVESCSRELSTAYLQRRGVPSEDLRIGLLIQRYLQASCGGVLLTSGRGEGRGLFLISATRGSPAALVRGDVRAAEFELSRLSGRSVGTWGAQVAAVQELLGPHVYALFDLGMELEALFAEPQCCEWIVDVEDAIYLLQTQPYKVVSE